MRSSISTNLVFLAFAVVPAFGQNFVYHSDSPFGIQLMHEDSSRVASKVMFFDFDGDEDLDLFLTGIDVIDDFENWEDFHYFIEMQENVGDRRNPQFGDRVEVFSDFPFPLGYFMPDIGDINRDGDPDFVVFGEVNFFGGRTVLYLESDGRSPAGFEVIRADAFDLVDFVPESFFVPEIIDLDIDGDLDILMSGFDPAFAEEDGADVPVYYYARNQEVRSASAPEFEGWHWNPYGLTPNPLAEILTSGDIDNDGDIDMLGTALIIPEDSLNHIYVHLNTPGSNGKPAFSNTLTSPYGFTPSFGENQYLFPELVDLDGDGDLDLFVFQVAAQGNVLQYYENTMCEVTVDQQEATICDDEQIDINGVIYDMPGVYTIISEDPDGCTSILELTLIVEPTYDVTLEESICEGDVFFIGFQDFTEEGIYQILLFTEAGCDSIVTLFLDVYETSFIQVFDTACEGVPMHEIVTFVDHNGCDSIVEYTLEVIEIDPAVSVNETTLTALHAGASYHWIDCDTGLDIPGATGQSYEVLVTGNYAVEVTDGSCTETSECVFVMITTGLYVQPYANDITIYPNPADNVISIRNETSLEISSMMFFNISGQLVGEFDLDLTRPLDISTLEPGVYLAKLYIGEQIVVRKLIVL